MPFDIYGERLRAGHCEVHPHVHEEYPCSICLAEHQQNVARETEYAREMERQYARDLRAPDVSDWSREDD